MLASGVSALVINDGRQSRSRSGWGGKPHLESNAMGREKGQYSVSAQQYAEKPREPC